MASLLPRKLCYYFSYICGTFQNAEYVHANDQEFGKVGDNISYATAIIKQICSLLFQQSPAEHLWLGKETRDLLAAIVFQTARKRLHSYFLESSSIPRIYCGDLESRIKYSLVFKLWGALFQTGQCVTTCVWALWLFVLIPSPLLSGFWTNFTRTNPAASCLLPPASGLVHAGKAGDLCASPKRGGG